MFMGNWKPTGTAGVDAAVGILLYDGVSPAVGAYETCGIFLALPQPLHHKKARNAECNLSFLNAVLMHLPGSGSELCCRSGLVVSGQEELMT